MDTENPGSAPEPQQPEMVSGANAMPQQVFAPTDSTGAAAAPAETPAPTSEPQAPAAPQAIEPAAPAAAEAPTEPSPSVPAAPSASPMGPATFSHPYEPTAAAGAPDAQSVAGGMVGGTATTGGTRRWPKFALPVIAAVVVLGGSASAYFGYVVPNKPDNMWHRALVNTGKGYDKLSTYATTAQSAKGWSEDGTFKFTGPVVVDGTVSGKSDGQNGDFTGSVSATGLKVNMDVRTIKSTGDSPDLYFKVDGLEGLGGLLGSFGADPTAAQALSGLNNQWYVVDHTLFEQYAKSTGTTSTQFSSADVSSILNAVGKASKQYVFTADDQKAVVVVKDKVGKEKLGNRSVYHYKVTVNKQHLKSYLTALCTDLKASKLSQILPSQQDLNCSDWQKQADSFKEGDTADAWVDTHTKLIRDIRITESTDKNSYVDIGQDYQGGNAVPFLFGFHSKSGQDTTDVDMKLTLDTKTNGMKLDGQLKMSGQDSENGNISMTLTPNSNPVHVDKPAGAKNIMQLMNDFGLGDLGGGSTPSASVPTSSLTSGTQAKARDAKRQADMNSLQTQLEAFFAQNGYYPNLGDMQSPAWRKLNMPSLDDSVLQDPQGTTHLLASAPAAKVYAYQVTDANGKPCEADDTSCAKYKLTATLEVGGTYVKNNLD